MDIFNISIIWFILLIYILLHITRIVISINCSKYNITPTTIQTKLFPILSSSGLLSFNPSYDIDLYDIIGVGHRLYYSFIRD